MKAVKVFLSASALLSGLTVAPLMGLASAAQASISLDPAVNYPVGRSGNVVRNTAVADFNGDGKLDLAVPNSSDRTVSILPGKGDGTFVPGGAYTVDTGAGGNSPRFVAAADFNEDGTVDLAVSDNGNDEVVVLLGNGDGTFREPVNYGLGTGTGPNGMAVGDFNRDGHLDLTVANTGSANIAILRGSGSGAFQAAVNFAAGTNPYAVAAGDFDGDGDLDLAVANRTAPGTVSILRNNGGGTFGAPASFTTGENSRSLTVGDFDRDGNADLAVANEGFLDVSVLLGTGTGTFQAAVNYPAGSNPRFVTSADLNGDGILDLAVTDGNDNFVYLLHGNSDGTFEATVPFMVGRRPDGVTIADFNGDGKPDVVTANTNSDNEPFGIWNVSVLLNTTSFEPTGVLAAKVDYPVGFNPNSMAAEDFNGDGVLDLVAANVYSGTVSYLQGAGDGTFGAAADYDSGAYYPYWVTAGDFNRDGKPDLAVVNLNQDGTISILLGNGDGAFQMPVNYGTGVYPVFVVGGDFNRDGKPDLAVANAGSDDISILLGNGDGTFQPELNFGVGAVPYAIAVGDFNRDGKLDLAVANYYSFSVSVLLGNGDGTFKLPADFDTGYNPIYVASADLNGDGLPDLAVANYWSGDVSVLSGIGNGNFLPAVNLKVGANPTAIAVSDFYSDGNLDLAVACESDDKVYVVPATGDGTFLAPVSFTTGTRPAALINGDFDRDGKIDVATANWGADSISVLLNWKDTVTPPTTPTGVNLNGTLNDKGVPGVSYGFSTGGSSGSMGHPVEYQFDWRGDGTNLSGWGPSTRSNGWDLTGTYQVRARARCATHPEVLSAWSEVLTVDIGGPTITNLRIDGGATDTSKTTAQITYTASPSATHIRTSTGGAWSAWLALPVVTHSVALGTVNGLIHVHAQVKDADGRISSTAWDSINLDTKAPTGVVKINGGNTAVLSGGVTTTVRVHLAMFDATVTGAQVRVKPEVTFSGDPDPSAPWGVFDASNTGQDVILRGAGAQKVFVQFMDGVGLKSAVYSASITVSATGAPWPGPSAVTVSNVQINDGKLNAASSSVKLTYHVSQSTNIMARYLYGTAWTAWEIPAVSAGKVTRPVTLSATNGVRQVYVQLLETTGSAKTGAMTDPKFASIVLDTVAPGALVQINHGATPLRRFNTNLNYLVLTILATDSASGLDKIALSQTGSSASATVPPPADSPDWFDYTPTVDSFGLNTNTTGAKSVYVWLKDRAGKISARKVATVRVVP